MPGMISSPSLMETEISQEPAAIARTLEVNAAEIERLCREIRSRNITTVMIAARGSSDNAGTYAKYLFQSFNQKIGRASCRERV